MAPSTVIVNGPDYFCIGTIGGGQGPYLVGEDLLFLLFWDRRRYCSQRLLAHLPILAEASGLLNKSSRLLSVGTLILCASE